MCLFNFYIPMMRTICDLKKKNSSNFISKNVSQTISLIISSIIVLLIVFNLNLNFGCNDNNTPVFFISFITFFFTNIISYFALSFLGLYGVFILNAMPLIITLINLLYYIDYFFIYDYTMDLVMFK